MANLLRLLTLLALLMMPFGMAAAPAAPTADHHTSATMPTGHCPQGAPESDLTDTFSGCAMPCAAALPAVDLTPGVAERMAQTATEPSFGPSLSSVELEIATPPPKLI